MSIAVAILDRDEWTANADIIVVVDRRHRRLTWVPRDLWAAPALDHRINATFRGGGPEMLARALHLLGFACDGVMILRRSAVEAALAPLRIAVPVKERLDFWYPLHPTLPIEEGRKQITFEPPGVLLEGERVHQWIGARYAIGRRSSDLDRIRRQKVLLRAMLTQHVDFPAVLRDSNLVRVWGRDPMPTLRGVRAGWRMKTYGPLQNAVIDEMQVLVPRTPPEPIRARFWHPLVARCEDRLWAMTARLGAARQIRQQSGHDR